MVVSTLVIGMRSECIQLYLLKNLRAIKYKTFGNIIVANFVQFIVVNLKGF